MSYPLCRSLYIADVPPPLLLPQTFPPRTQSRAAGVVSRAACIACAFGAVVNVMTSPLALIYPSSLSPESLNRRAFDRFFFSFFFSTGTITSHLPHWLSDVLETYRDRGTGGDPVCGQNAGAVRGAESAAVSTAVQLLPFCGELSSTDCPFHRQDTAWGVRLLARLKTNCIIILLDR